MRDEQRVADIFRADPVRWHVLGLVEALGLPDCWIGAGFVRNAIWDHLHQRPPAQLISDVDVIWFDPSRADAWEDRRIEDNLRQAAPDISWSVKNQARMHRRNGDARYRSANDAMRHWPETATAVAARRYGEGQCAILAPHGLADLLDLRLRPTSSFRGKRHAIFDARVAAKKWLEIWPLLRLANQA